MITVFYANMVYGQYEDWRDYRIQVNFANSAEIYNGAFVYVSSSDRIIDQGWYTADGCPYPEDQIDPRMKAWLLLLS